MNRHRKQSRNKIVMVLSILGLSLLGLLLAGCSSKKRDAEGEAQNISPATGDNDFWLGRSAFRQGDYQKAVTLLEAARQKPLKEYSADQLFLTLGKSYWGIGELKNAIECYDKALAEDATLFEALVCRGVAFRQLKDYDQANESYEQALKLKPEDASLRNSLGALAIAQGNFDKAVESLKLATELDPTSPVAYSNLALAYAHLGRYEESQKKLDHATALGYKRTDVVQAKINLLKFAELRERDPLRQQAVQPQQNANPKTKPKSD